MTILSLVGGIVLVAIMALQASYASSRADDEIVAEINKIRRRLAELESKNSN